MIIFLNVIVQFALCALNVALALQGGEYAWLSWSVAVFVFMMGLQAIAMMIKYLDLRSQDGTWPPDKNDYT